MITAVKTWITRVRRNCKQILKGIGLGEGQAIWARCPQMTGHGAKFGRKKEEAIVALLTTRTTEEAGD